MYHLQNDPWFQQKYREVPSIFNDWISPYLDLETATLLDFGCGDGVISLGIAHHLKPAKLIAVDSQYLFQKLGAVARVQAGIEALPENLQFKHITPGQSIASAAKASCIFSWSVFEHVDKTMLKDVVNDLREALTPNGFLFLQIHPLFYSPFGSHLHNFISKPWAHLLEQENHLYNQVMAARRRLGDDPDTDYAEDYDFVAFQHLAWRGYQSLNKITGDQLVDLLSANGFHCLREYRTECEQTPPAELARIYHEDVLKNDQIVLLFQKQ